MSVDLYVYPSEVATRGFNLVKTLVDLNVRYVRVEDQIGEATVKRDGDWVSVEFKFNSVYQKHLGLCHTRVSEEYLLMMEKSWGSMMKSSNRDGCETMVRIQEK